MAAARSQLQMNMAHSLFLPEGERSGQSPRLLRQALQWLGLAFLLSGCTRFTAAIVVGVHRLLPTNSLTPKLCVSAKPSLSSPFPPFPAALFASLSAFYLHSRAL